MNVTVKISDNILSPLGMDTEANYRAVRSGRSALAVHEGTFGIPEPFVASLFDRDSFPLRSGEPRPFFERMLIESVCRALEGATVDPTSHKVLFIISSIKGNVEDLGVKDDLVPVSVSAQRVASFFGNPNPPLVVSNACISGLSALIQGKRMLEGGHYDHVIVCGAECQSSFIVSGFQSLKALSSTECRPFDKNRDGLNLGEGAATMILGRKEAAGPGDWTLVAGACRNDANHISGPSRVGEGSYRALLCAMDPPDGGLPAFVNVHGTATLYNDEMESVALERAGLSEVPVNALKGFFGHTMGAAGILESLVSMRALEDGVVLPTRGFSESGVSHPVDVSAQERHCSGKSFIKLISGFGGCNAAMLFRLGR